ncbi:MAG: pitrilysin family protein [Desulfuromonadales bacterium]|nr:pitrilysin family protein [Desulfuromonadales bacterium]MDT8423455.1 pitrilysin family protein [Desulfuromonadales bacterium]
MIEPFFQKTVLTNGLRVVTVNQPQLHSAEMVCYVGVGSRNETPATAGTSHFLEHMLFRGTAEHATSLELESAFEMIGGAVNASTDAETTCFHSRLHPQRLAEGAQLFAAMIRRPRFGDLEVERKIILEEAMEDLNEKGEMINPDYLTGQLLWPGHPLSLPTIGTLEAIRAQSLDGLRHYLQQYYTPTNIVLTVAGAVEHGAAVAAAEMAFGDWHGIPAPPPQRLPLPVETALPELAWIRDSDSQINLQLAFPTPGRDDERQMCFRVLRRMLAWGGTSRLMHGLRERLGLVYHVDANLSMFVDGGVFSIDLTTTPVNLVAAVGETLSILAAVRDTPVTVEELTRVKQSYLYALDFSRDHAEEMATRYGWGELTGCVRDIEQDRHDIEAVTAADLLAVARDVFRGTLLKGAIVGPWKKTDITAVKKLLAKF